MSGIFFPQRIPLRLDGGSASPAVLEKKIVAAAHAPSFAIGEVMLRKLAGIPLSGRGLNKTTVKIGTEMVLDRDARTSAYFEQPLPRQHTEPATPVALACVSVDGGRMQTREEGQGTGVHRPHWRENKNALFLRMKSRVFGSDPHPDLPTCFADPERMKQLLSGLGEASAPSVEGTPTEPDATQPQCDDWRPERLFRTGISSLEDSDQFGRMMEVEADARGFYQASAKAFVSDGLPYNWTIQERHFPDFVPILDFVHAVERLYEAARCIHADEQSRWSDYLRWARTCWSGHIGKVLDELREHQSRLGMPLAAGDKSDPRKLLADAIGYFENSVARMNYPAYRQQGLPTTSAHMESFVKEMNARVKSTSKFWNDGPDAEAILQIRAAALCDDDRLSKFLANRPGFPFHANVMPKTPLSTAS